MIKGKKAGLILRIGCAGLSISALSCMSGCATATVLTAQQQDMVAEYSAKAVLKHDKNYKKTKIVDVEETESETTKGIDEIEEETLFSDSKADEESTTVAIDDDTKEVHSDMAELLDFSPATLTYTGMDIVKTYPDTNETQFVLNATQGNNLLILKFNLANNTADSVNIPMLTNAVSLKAEINGVNSYSALLTLLLDALNTYSGTLESGQNENLVLVYEIPENENVEKLNLIIKSASGKDTFELK